MTNSIGTNASSMATRATSVFGSAKDAFKAIADAATNGPSESPATVAESTARKGRRGTVLDRFA